MTIIFSLLPTFTFNGSILGDSKLIWLFFKLLMWGPIWFWLVLVLIYFFKNHIIQMNIY